MFVCKSRITSNQIPTEQIPTKNYYRTNIKVDFDQLLEKSESLTDIDKIYLVSMIVPHDCQLEPYIFDVEPTLGGRKSAKKLGGGNNFTTVHQDFRRDIYAICIPKFKLNPEQNNGYYILKIVHNNLGNEEPNDYVYNYYHESLVYDTFKEKGHTTDIVTLYKSPDAIIDSKSYIICHEDIEIKTVELETNQKSFYLLMENTYNMKDFSLMLQHWNDETEQNKTIMFKSGINTVIQTLYNASCKTSFIHGDFHIENVKISKD